MSKSVQNVKNSLKFKAQPKEGIISVRVGVKKFNVPVEARMLSNGEFMYLSFPALSELFRVSGKELKPMGPSEDASDAHAALSPTRRRGRRRSSNAELPAELEQALKGLPSGYRLGYGPDGSPKLVKTRTRRSSKK